MTSTISEPRSISSVIDSVRTHEGAGFAVRRPFPTQFVELVDPFLLLDEMGPSDYGPDEAVGAPDHPHRGFETVTYILDGLLEHKDSVGNTGLLGVGDVQWMTAGAGVVHSEMPEAEFTSRGGRMHGFQLWVNLPAAEKMIKPRYQDTPSDRIPLANTDDGLATVTVIAGNALGEEAVIETRTPIMYLHFRIQPGGQAIQSVPRNFNGFVYVIDGRGAVNSTPVESGQMAILANDGEEVLLTAPPEAEETFSALLIAGVPINEPVARYGPFVMNTREEIIQAIEDYRSGRMGEILH